MAKLQVLAKTLFHKGEATTDRPDAVFHENYGSHMMAGMMRAEALISTSSTRNSPTQMGVADVQTINHAMNSKEMQMMRRDQEWLDDPSANAFSFSETATASPLDPAYIDAAKASRGVVDGEPVPSMDEIGNTLSKRTAHRSEASIAAENGKDKKLADDNGTSVAAVRMDRLDRRLKALAEREADKAMNNETVDAREKAEVVQREVMKNKILQGFRHTFGYGAGEAEEKRNMYKLGQGGVIRGSNPMKSPFEAVGQFVLDNDMVNHMGWLAGPQYAAGLFLTRWDATKKEFASTEGPASVAMAPLSVFARDYKLVGTAARDYPMVTAFRIAEETGVPVEDVIADMNANGFFAVHKKWIAENYNNLADKESQIRFEENGLAAAGMVSDIRRKKLSEKGRAQLDEASDAWLRELGGAEGTLDNLEWVDGRIDFIGVREHLKSHPTFFRRLQKVAGQEFTIDEFAAQLSLSRQDLVDMAVRQQQGKQQPDDMPVVITPRTEGDVVKQNQIDYVNGMEVVDHNIVPGREGEVPLFTESQMIHILNLSSNRKLVKNIIDAHRFGMDIDPSKELDNILRTSNDDFAMGNAVHGFETSVRSEQDAKRLQAASENEQPLFDMGKRVAKDYGLKNIPAGELEVLGLVHTLYNTGLILKGNKISKEGMEVLAAFFPDMDGSMRIETAERMADMITDKKVDIWNGAQARRTALSAAESEAEYRANPMPPRDEAADEARDESGNPLPVEDPYDLGDVDPETAPVLDIHEKTSEPSHSPPLITDITIDSPQNDRLGNMFLGMLEHRHRIDGSQAAGNAAAVFKNLTGRDGSANGISSAEGMMVMEISFVDKDFQNALWGGEMDVADGGPLSMTFVEDRSGRLQTKLNGLAEVKKAMKDKGVSAAAYMLTHELVERLDFANMVRGRSKGSAKMNQVSSSVGRLFMENFGTAAGRTKWKKIFKEIGVFDGKIKEFMDAAERLAKDDMTVAETQGAAARLRAEGGDEARDVMTEGFTQVLTMALMAKQGRKESALGKRFGGPLLELAEALAGKMHKVADHVGRFGVTDRNTDSADVLSGAFLKDDQRLDSLVYNTLGNMAKNVKYDKLVRREEARTSYRMWGGKPDVDDVSPVSRSIGDVQAEMRILNEKLLAASGRGRQVIQLKLNSLEQELFGLTNDPRHVMPDDVADEIFDNFADESGLVDTRSMGDGEGFKLEMKLINDVLGNVETKQSRGLGAGMNYVAGKFNAGGALAANNSEFDVIRAMWALANPEAVNTQLNNNNMWLSDQMAADALSRDKRNMMGAMRMVEKRLNKLSSSKDPDKNLANQREVVKFFENPDRAQAQQDLADLGFKANEVNALEAARQELFEPQTGFIARLAKAMYETGAMGKRDYEAVAANPRLPDLSARTWSITPTPPRFEDILRAPSRLTSATLRRTATRSTLLRWRVSLWTTWQTPLSARLSTTPCRKTCRPSIGRLQVRCPISTDPLTLIRSAMLTERLPGLSSTRSGWSCPVTSGPSWASATSRSRGIMRMLLIPIPLWRTRLVAV